MANIFLWAKDVERAVHKVREHAEKRENWYRPGITTTIPGDDAFHVVWSGTVKAVFSWAVVGRSWNPRHPPPGTLLRYLSVSVAEGEGRYPRPDVIFTLAHHFGFTGGTVDADGLCHTPGPTWIFEADEQAGCALIQQIVEGVTDGPPPSVFQ